jgi:hypothetical protein
LTWLGKEAARTLSAAKAGMDRKTTRKYQHADQLPSHRRADARPRDWQTRPDPFADVWGEVVELLEQATGWEAKTLVEELQRRHPGRFPDGQLRTLQRRVKHWRATQGPDKEEFFAQDYPPGRLGASDFTHLTELGVTIQGQPFAHLVYHFVLTQSNWEHVTLCFTESFASVSAGFQNAVWALGGVPARHRRDRMSLAVQASGTEEFSGGVPGYPGAPHRPPGPEGHGLHTVQQLQSFAAVRLVLCRLAGGRPKALLFHPLAAGQRSLDPVQKPRTSGGRAAAGRPGSHPRATG